MGKTANSGSFAKVTLKELQDRIGNADIIISRKWAIANGLSFVPLCKGIVVNEAASITTQSVSNAKPSDEIPITIHKPEKTETKTESQLANI